MKYAMHKITEDGEIGEKGVMIYTDVYGYTDPDNIYMNDQEDEKHYNDLEKAIDLVSKKVDVDYADLGLMENCHFVATDKPKKFMKALEKEMIIKDHIRLVGE